jgi:hypothetical protein
MSSVYLNIGQAGNQVGGAVAAYLGPSTWARDDTHPGYVFVDSEPKVRSLLVGPNTYSRYVNCCAGGASVGYTGCPRLLAVRAAARCSVGPGILLADVDSSQRYWGYF